MIRGLHGCSRRIFAPILLFPALLISLAVSSLGAQEVQGTLSLDEAIRLARGHNPTFLSTENDQGPADWSVRESYGLFLPNFTTSLSGNYLAPGSPSFGIFDAGDLGLAVTDYYFSGYNLQASYRLDGSSLFRVASARADRKATDARVQAAAYDLDSNVTAQYMLALQARDGVEVSTRQLERAQQNYDLADARVAVGATTPTDAKQAEVERGRAQIALLEAESSLRTEKLRLLEQLGVEASGDFELVSEFDLFPALLGSGRPGGPGPLWPPPASGVPGSGECPQGHRSTGLERVPAEPRRVCHLVRPGPADRRRPIPSESGHRVVGFPGQRLRLLEPGERGTHPALGGVSEGLPEHGTHRISETADPFRE